MNLTQLERDALIRLVNDDRNWECADDPDEPEQSKAWRFLLRAKRINVYPDRVELVFRDHGERPMTPAFAIEVAQELLRTIGSPPEADKTLCEPASLGCPAQTGRPNTGSFSVPTGSHRIP